MRFLAAASYQYNSIFSIDGDFDVNDDGYEGDVYPVYEVPQPENQNIPAVNANECIILAHDITDRAMLLPCRHANLCYLCTHLVEMQDSRCPTCRTTIDSIVNLGRLYL